MKEGENCPNSSHKLYIIYIFCNSFVKTLYAKSSKKKNTNNNLLYINSYFHFLYYLVYIFSFSTIALTLELHFFLENIYIQIFG